MLCVIFIAVISIGYFIFLQQQELQLYVCILTDEIQKINQTVDNYYKDDNTNNDQVKNDEKDNTQNNKSNKDDNYTCSSVIESKDCLPSAFRNEILQLKKKIIT